MDRKLENDQAVSQILIGLVILAMVALGVYLLVSQDRMYRKALSDCMLSGNTKQYCEMMLN